MDPLPRPWESEIILYLFLLSYTQPFSDGYQRSLLWQKSHCQLHRILSKTLSLLSPTFSLPWSLLRTNTCTTTSLLAAIPTLNLSLAIQLPPSTTRKHNHVTLNPLGHSPPPAPFLLFQLHISSHPAHTLKTTQPRLPLLPHFSSNSEKMLISKSFQTSSNKRETKMIIILTNFVKCDVTYPNSWVN